MSVSLKTYNELLGQMIRKLIADTSLNDINSGSVLLTLLEAVATNDFENNTAILSVLDLLNVDALKNNDLDLRASDLGLTRFTAQKATGFTAILDSSITKRSTGLYPVKPAPIAGSTTIYVNDASKWAPTGTLYIGRGTSAFEGPINYTAITNYTTFFAITLGSALQNDHLISDVVVDGQGTTDRIIRSGTSVRIPANNISPEITYLTLRDSVIAAGEDSVTGVEVIAVKAGSQSNAGIGTVTSFTTPPFSSATVINTSAFTNGKDVETDLELRERIKSYANTLARGTKASILDAIIGVSDPTDNKQVASAVITEPVQVGDPSIVYLDDGNGFQPSFNGQSVDVLLGNATGREEFLQLANYPLPRPQVVNAADGPFQLADGMIFRILIDDIEEEVQLAASSFANVTAATLPEVVVALNNQAKTFKCRLHDNSTRLLVYPVAHDAEFVQVSPLRASDSAVLFANTVLNFPTDKFSYIKLYRNSTLLHEKQRAASLTTTPFSSWNIVSDSNLILSVDGTPPQNGMFTSLDFGGKTYSLLQLSDWVTAFNAKFAGIEAVATAGGSMQIFSNKIGANSSLEAISGSLFDKLFAQQESKSVGQNSDFQLNRQTGNLRILTSIQPGDNISAGTDDARGNIISSATISGTYNVSVDPNLRPAELVVLTDANVTVRLLEPPVGSTVTFSVPSSDTMRILASSALTFQNIQPHDYVYIVNRGDSNGTGSGSWADVKSCGLFRVTSKGPHITAGSDTYIEVHNKDTVVGTYTIASSLDIQAFQADRYPQIWKGNQVATPAAEPIQDLVNSLNNQLENVDATIDNVNTVRISSSTEKSGSISTPVSVGNASLLFNTGVEEETGNDPHVANKQPVSDVYATFKCTLPTNTNVWLDRYTYADVRGSVSTTVSPQTPDESPYGEEIKSTGVLNSSLIDHEAILAFTKGSNIRQVKSIQAIEASDTVGTQHSLPPTLMDHVVGDEFVVMKPLEISDEDSIVMILDQDAISKTIDIPLSRTGRVNSSFSSTKSAFSADDADNETGVNFGTLQVWGKNTNNTEFADYAVWFRARNWYQTGGAGSGLAAFIVRANEYGPAGEKIDFRLEHPQSPNQSGTFTHTNTPGGTSATYFFGSGPARPISISSGLSFQVSSLGSNTYRYTFSGSINLSPVQIGDIVAIANSSGVSTANSGSFSIVNKASNSIDVYNPNGGVTGVGAAEVTQVTCANDVIGTPAVHTIACVADVAGSLNGKYFTVYDSQGAVIFWYDLNNAGSAPPTVTGASRYVRIATVVTGDSATTLQTRLLKL